MADAVLSVEVRAKLEALSKGLGDAEKSIADFVNKGDRHISVIEQRFAQMGKSTKEISENIKASFGGMSLDKYFEVFGNSKQVIADAKAEVEKYKTEIENLKKVSADLKSQIDAKTEAVAKSIIATQNQKTATEAERTELARLRRELQELRNEKAKNAQATQATQGAYRQLSAELNEVRSDAKNLAAEMYRLDVSGQKNSSSFTVLQKKFDETAEKSNKLDRALKNIDASLGQHQRNVGNYTSALAGSIPYLGQFTSVAGLASAAAAGLSRSFQTNLKFDAIEYALGKVSGSTANFRTNIEFLNRSADRLGIDLYTMMRSFRQWEGAVQHSNITADQSREIFESVANAGAKMKLSTDEIQGTFLALSQMLSKGVVSMEELRRQLGDRLPGAFAMAARAMGMSEMELNKLVASGKLMSEDFLPKFAKELDRAFGNDQNEKIQSMQASVNRLRNEWDRLWRSEAATQFFSVISDGSANALGGLRNLLDTWQGVAGLAAGGVGSIVSAGIHNAFKDETEIVKGAADLNKKWMSALMGDGSTSGVVMDNILKEQNRILEENSKRVIQNKLYWEDSLKTLREAFGKLSTSDVGSKKWEELSAKIKEAEKNVNLYSSSKQDGLAKKAQKDADKAIKEAERQAKSVADVMKRSDNDIKKIQMSATEWEIEQLSQKYDEYRNIVGNNHDLLKRLETNFGIELNAIKLKNLTKEIEDRKKLDKEIQGKVDKQRKEHAQSISVDLVFDRRFTETAGQRNLRMLNAEYKQLADNATSAIRAMIEAGDISKSVGESQELLERTRLQEDYFQKVEEIYKRDQQTQLAMVDTRNIFNRSLEATNILLEENARKFQADAVTAEQYNNVQTALLNNKDMLTALHGAYEQLTTGVSDAFANMLTQGQSFGEGMEQVFKSMVSTIISQMMRLAAIKIFGGIMTGGLSTLLGFASGGYTGNVSRQSVAGVVHGQEFVFDAQSTKRIGVDNLKALQNGKIPSVSDLTPRISKNFSNFNPVIPASGRSVEVVVKNDFNLRNDTIKVAEKRAAKVEKKFGRGR